MAEELTDQQKLVVNDRGGRLLVSAAAGSGKTKVLVDRLLKYLTDPEDPANIDDFLIITFTKAAAAELRAKISKALTKRIEEDPTNIRLQQQFQRLYLAKISTVHSFCSDILREYAYRLDIPVDFHMIEDKEGEPLRYQVLEKVLDEAYKDMADSPELIAFVDTQGVGRSDCDLPDLILNIYESAKCHMDPEGWLDRCVRESDVCRAKDASETGWGRYLMDQLFAVIDMHCPALDKAAALCDPAMGLEKMAQYLRDISFQLQRIRKAKTWDEIHKYRNVEYYNLKTLNGTKKDPEVYSMAKYIRSACMDEIGSKLGPFGNDSPQVLSDLRSIAPAVQGLVSLVKKFDLAYDKLKKGLHIVDYSDLEHKALDLLWGKSRSAPTAAAKEIGQRFREIMVDEYQDSNEVQDSIFAALTERKQNLFMVGDVKQSIYQFRLADPGIFLDKYAHYVDAEVAKPGEGRRIILSNNFRSCGAVIDAVNSVFRRCMSLSLGGLDYGDDEALWEGIKHDPIDEPEVELHVLTTQDDVYSEEAAFVADRIQTLLDGTHMVRGENGLRPIVPDDIVILLRSPKTNGVYFRDALARKGYKTLSNNGIDLLQTDEVDWLRSLLRTINNPRQDIPLIAALTGPVFGFTVDDLAAVKIDGKGDSFFESLIRCKLPKAERFLEILKELRDAARLHSLPELIENIFSLTQADAVYSAMENGGERGANLRDFYHYAVSYDARGDGSLQQFLDHLVLCEKDGIDPGRSEATGGCIQISSIHKSKGLEYPVVFLCCLSKTFNTNSAHGRILSNQYLGLGLSCVENHHRTRYPSIANYAISQKILSEGVAEELRILYVAMTRPKDRLIMTYANSKAEEKLMSLGARMQVTDPLLINISAHNLGQWVLHEALYRAEAGVLFGVMGGSPVETVVSKTPWLITHTCTIAVDDDHEQDDEECRAALPEGVVDSLRNALSFSYPYKAATMTPSKQTATQRKGRLKDQEAAENVAEKWTKRSWRMPTFREKVTDGRTYGNATHAVMQYIRYECCKTLDGVKEELRRLILDGFITEEQADMVSAERLYAFFSSDLGSRLCDGQNVLREFKFSILDDASAYDDDLLGEKVLLQGVVDCALVDPDGIIILDFKTDRVNEETIAAVSEGYRPQVEVYAQALSRIYELPVKEKALYFFSMDRFQWL